MTRAVSTGAYKAFKLPLNPDQTMIMAPVITTRRQ